jgi:uncharacterized protein (TIRG00374 family)
MRKFFSFGLFLALGFLIFYLFLYQADLHRVGRYLAEADWMLLAAAVAVNLLSIVVRVWRWRVLLRPAKPDPSNITLAVATFGGYLISTVLPGRLGEVIRPLYVAAREDISRVTCLSTAVVERVLDVLALLILFGIYLFTFRPSTDEYSLELLMRIMAGGIAACLLVFGVLYWLVRTRRELPLPRALRPHVENVRRGLEFLSGARMAGSVLGLTLLIWLCVGLNTWMVVRAFGVSLPLTAPFMLMAVSAVGFLIPTPAGIGGVHKAFQVGLVVFHGVNYDLATAIALVGHALGLGPIALVGLAGFWWAGVPFKEMLRFAKMKD